MSDLYRAVKYRAPIDYIISSVIREYDISKANITILHKYGVLSDEQYVYYRNCDRMQRQVAIGLLIKSNPEVGTVLKNGITEARRAFFEANNIQDFEVLSIKNDAIYVIGREMNITLVDGVEFVCKNIYTSYYCIKNKEYYYFLDRTNGIECIDIKGMSSDRLYLHNEYFLDFLKALFYSAQVDSIDDTVAMLKNFYMAYVERALDIGYYRRFDGIAQYDIIGLSAFSDFRADYAATLSVYDVDISYNLSILIDLQKIFSSIYFQRNKMYGR